MEGSQGRDDNMCGNFRMAAVFSSPEQRQGWKTRDQLRGNCRNPGERWWWLWWVGSREGAGRVGVQRGRK